MGNSLKDALQKAGFKKSKQENERPKMRKKDKTKKVKLKKLRLGSQRYQDSVSR